jgi:AbrB family looped-hinge helix DNA binding protein
MKLYGQLSTKGQVVIPAELREKFGLRPGTRVAIEDAGGCIVLRPITDAFIESLRGCLKGQPLSEIREKEHKRDREL